MWKAAPLGACCGVPPSANQREEPAVGRFLLDALLPHTHLRFFFLVSQPEVGNLCACADRSSRDTAGQTSLVEGRAVTPSWAGGDEGIFHTDIASAWPWDCNSDL